MSSSLPFQLPSARRLCVSGLVLLLGAASLAVAAIEFGDVGQELSGMQPGWIAAAVLFELGSCLSFVAIFRHFFHDVPAGEARKLAWTGLASNALLPGGGVSGMAVPAWLMHQRGMPARTAVRRASGLFCLTSAVNVGVLLAAGGLLVVGIASGPHDLLRAGLPTLGAAVVAGAACALVAARRKGGGAGSALVEGALDAGEACARPGWRLLGAAGYLLFDIAALWAAVAAAGCAQPVTALIVAYIVGYLANLVPMPGGIGALDAGLAGALVAYGAPVTQAAAAVLVYHAIAFWLPSLGGLACFASLRRRLRRRARFQ